MRDQRMPDVSVVVPVYNAAGRLEELIDALDQALVTERVEVVLVNDGSADQTWAEIVDLSRDGRVRGIDLMRNYGQHNALLAGIRAATAPIVVTIDDDLQNPPAEIPRLLTMLREGADLVYGSPIQRQHGVFRNLGTWLAKRSLAVVIGSESARNASAFRAFRTDLREAFRDFGGSYVSIDVLLSWGARRIQSVPVAHQAREHGRSSYNFGRLATHALNVLTGFSTRPLRFASLLGLATTALGFVVLVFVIARYFIQGNPVPGFPLLASLISIFSGVQLLTLGIMGEYLARMHVRIMERPPYIIRTEASPASPELE
jgi:glycosyltransferase involved in cell wall biosynthesis